MRIIKKGFGVSMLKEVKSKEFANGKVYVLMTEDGYPIEVTDTFLPYYTKDCINEHINQLKDYHLGSRAERWMIGVSVMSGCNVRCRFCATGQLKKWRNLTSDEIVEQVQFILNKHPEQNPKDCKEFKINFTRMGEPYLNIENVKSAVEKIEDMLSDTYVHCFISTIGIKGSDFSWINGNRTLQVSLHSLDEDRRNNLIPFKNKMTIEELGQIRTESDLKTTVNMTLVDTADFDIEKLKKYFDPKFFFIKVSPINPNPISEKNKMGKGVITTENLI